MEKIKAIYHTMNMFKVHQSSLIAECWFPVKALDEIRRALTVGEVKSVPIIGMSIFSKFMDLRKFNLLCMSSNHSCHFRCC